MSAASDAQAHLSKAREFLQAAQFNQELGLHSPATSDAVLAGVNAKDAICLRANGQTNKSDDHRQAVTELKNAGPAGKDLADGPAPTRARAVPHPVGRRAVHRRWRRASCGCGT